MGQDRATNRLKGSDLGYFGKGMPDPKTISKLQNSYFQKLMNEGYVSPEIRFKYERMQLLQRTALGGERTDEKALDEAGKLAAELAPIMHFKVDDVDWDE